MHVQFWGGKSTVVTAPKPEKGVNAHDVALLVVDVGPTCWSFPPLIPASMKYPVPDPVEYSAKINDSDLILPSQVLH